MSQKFLDMDGLRYLAQKESEAYNAMVVVSDSRPANQKYNKIWIKETADAEIEIPTYEEFAALQERVERLEALVAELTQQG